MTRIRSRIRRLLMPVVDGPTVVAPAPVVPLREIFRRFWPYARPYRKWIFIGLLFAVAVPAVETAEIWLFKLVVDEVLVPKELAPLLPIALAYLALTLLGGLLSFGDEYVATWVGEKFLLNLRGRLYAHVQGLSLDSLDRRRLGDVLSRLTSDVQAIESFVLSGIGDGLSAIVRILFFGGALFFLNWQLALVSLVVIPLFYGVARRFARLVKHAAREKRRRSGSLGAVAEEGIANAALVQGYNRQATEVARFKRENEGILEAELASARIRGLFAPLVDLIELLGAMIVIGLGTVALTQGSLTLGGLLVFLTYLTQLYGPIRDLSRLSNTIFAASAGAERVIELLEERPAVSELPSAKAISRARGRVELREVTFRYPGASRDALDGVSLTVEPGSTVALVGPSGAGKSTVARLLMRFADPASGSIHLDGHDLRDIRLDSLRENLGVLLQETLIFDGTVRENIAYGREGATDAEIEEAARAAGAHEFIQALPDGYDARIGQRGRRLSGGQRQRIAIARVLVRDAPVLVLDEPGTGIDDATKADLMEPLQRLMKGRTTLVISHDLWSVRDADEIVVMQEGRVAERRTQVPA